VFGLAWRGVRHNPARYIATLVAIITGVAFFSATGFLSDRVIDALQGDVDRQYGNVDAAVTVETEGTDATFADRLRISGTSADKIAATPGVEATAGVLTGKVAFRAQDGSTFADGATGRLWVADDELNPIDVVEGSAPTAAGQVAVDKGTAERHDLHPGQKTTILTLAGAFPVTIVGITEFGSADALDSDGTVSIARANAFDWLSRGQVEYKELYVRGSGSPTELAAAIEPSVPTGFMVQDGDQFRQDKRDEVGAPGKYLKYALQAFAILAMLVGGFVIFNTFSVIVSQRLRELAVMSAIGATPKQIKRSLRYEGVVIGVVGSLLGLLVGFFLTFLLGLALAAFGVSLPGSGAKIGLASVVPAVLIGTIITVLSVMIPARRAAKTEPIEALRTAAVERSPFSIRRIVITLVLVVGGAAGLVFGSKVMIGVGALALFVGVIVGGPFIAVFGARVLRPVMSRFGLEGRLAADNTARSPQRTATTANALLIGVFLVTLISVAGTSAKDYVVGELKKLETADYIVVSDGGTIDPNLVRSLESVNGVDKVVAFRRESVTVDGDPSQIFTGDIAALEEVAGIDVKDGSIDSMAPGTIAVVERGDKTPTMGSTVVVKNSEGKSADLKVAAVLKFSLDTGMTGSYVPTGTFDGLVGATAPTVAFVGATSGEQTDTKDAIDTLTKQRPDITVQEGNFIGRLIGSIFDFLINAVNGLLVMSIVIALIGIINTLSLSILERRRELGLLRAVGMTDDRVRRMVRLEAVIISALGTVTGVALGLFTGWGLIHAINRATDAHIALSLPGLRLGLVLVLGVILGLLASVIPARRSTKLDVLDAIQAT
jgi:putative ABC transport system permease protein